MTQRWVGPLVLLSGILFLLTLEALWFFRKVPLLSPITSSTTFQFLSEPSQPTHTDHKLVYGFLPYWNKDKVTLQPELTHLSYFSLEFNQNGDILDHKQGEMEMGFHTLQSEQILSLFQSAAQRGSKIEVTLAQFDPDQISTFLLSPAAQEKLLRSLDGVLQGYPVQGINIDIEYTGTVTPNLRDDYTKFIQLLADHIHSKYQNIHLSIDVFASAGTNRGIWDLPQLSKIVDHIIVMAYDFHRKSSISAGPVAPLFGGQKLWDSDITEHLRDFLSFVPHTKLVLGVPFYGYAWQTTSRDSQAKTFPDTGEAIGFDQIQSLLLQKNLYSVKEGWNTDALSPYLSYQKDREIHLIYYENSRSMSYKLDLVNQLDLGGIAIWALGYEGSSRELWDVIKNKL